MIQQNQSSSLIVEYAKSTKNICMCVSITMFLIVLFMMTPLNSFILSSFFGKLIILILLGYIIYYNINQNNKFARDFNISLTGNNWNVLKTNLSCSYIFTLFLIILFFSVVRQMI